MLADWLDNMRKGREEFRRNLEDSARWACWAMSRRKGTTYARETDTADMWKRWQETQADMFKGGWMPDARGRRMGQGGLA